MALSLAAYTALYAWLLVARVGLEARRDAMRADAERALPASAGR